jgi:plasmid stabilization system protein ParE
VALRKPVLAVVLAPTALAEVSEIWRYNALQRGVRQADAYEAFLTKHLYALASNYDLGRVVEPDKEYRYTTIKRRSKADGHIGVYRIDQSARTVRVLHIFHTKQDWKNKL